MDPNTLNLDPGPDPGLILSQYGSRVISVLSILKEKIQNNFREIQFTLKQVYFLNYKHILSDIEIFNQSSL